MSSVDEALRAATSGGGVHGVQLSSECGDPRKVRDGWVKLLGAGLKPSGSLCTKGLSSTVLCGLLSAFRALLHSGFSVTETSQRQLLMFSSICANSITC